MSRHRHLAPIAPESPATASDPEPKSERITDDELAYHQHVVRESQQAEAMAAEAERLIATARGMQAAAASWSRHLAERYGLADGDRVTADGLIVRQPHAPAATGEHAHG